MTCQNIFDPVGDYLATTVETGDGATTSWDFSWPYLNQDNWTVNSPDEYSSTYNPYIRVYVAGILTPYKMPNAYTIQVATAPAYGASVVIRRDSDIANRKVDWVAGSTISEEVLDRDSLQAFYLLQEMYDRALDAQCQINNTRYINSYLFDGDSDDAVDGINAVFHLRNDNSEETNLLERAEVVVLLNGTVQQARSTSYSMSMDDGVCAVTFASAPVNGTKVEIRTLVSAIPQTLTLADNSVTTSKIANGAVTFAKINFDASGSNGQALMKRSGSATFSTITPSDVSGLAAFVTAYKVTDLAAPTTNFSMNNHKITNLATPTNGGDAAPKSYVDSLFTTTYQAFEKRAIVSLTRAVSLGSATGVTTTCPFEPDHIELYLIGPSSTDRACIANNYYNSATGGQVNGAAWGWKSYDAYAWSDLASPVDWQFSPMGAKINISKSGTDITLKFYGSTTNGDTCKILLKMFKNSPSV